MGRSWRWMEGSGQASLIDIRLDTWDPPSRDIGVWTRPLGPLTRSGHTHPLAFFLKNLCENSQTQWRVFRNGLILLLEQVRPGGQIPPHRWGVSEKFEDRDVLGWGRICDVASLGSRYRNRWSGSALSGRLYLDNGIRLTAPPCVSGSRRHGCGCHERGYVLLPDRTEICDPGHGGPSAVGRGTGAARTFASLGCRDRCEVPRRGRGDGGSRSSGPA